MLQEIEDLREGVLRDIVAAGTQDDLRELRVRHLGKKSRLRGIMRAIGEAAAADRPAMGQAAGRAQKQIQAAFDARQSELEAAEDGGKAFDLTVPGRRPLAGRLHPLTQLTEELIAIFSHMGFNVAEGPEVEDEYHNFDALNTPGDHPARDLHDTFYLQDGRLLRTHTSPVQIRVMEGMPPPVRAISLGRCYRRDTVDATHHFAFHQIEGFYVDEKVSFADLKGTIGAMGRELLGEDTRVRFRPHFFPFTEPSVEYDFSCSICGGAGSSSAGSPCRICKGTGWVEIAGAGMVDPAVFAAVGYDSERYTGFAFGMGIERIAMIRHGIDDIRLFLENDLRFIRQFQT